MEFLRTREEMFSRLFQGQVAFGLIPSNFKESTGDTLGGIGSAIAIQPGSFKALGNGSYTGTFIVQPDRGYNVYVSHDQSIFTRLFLTT
jgi:hypothetical protein